jgi:CubicO group peptidase (beta-lactamase class C family)
MAEIHGVADEGFGAVADAFARNFDERGDVGAACCVYLDGRPVVDLWGGIADPATGREWESDTPVIVFSVNKGATAICVLGLVEQGELDLDTTIAEYWPEFAVEGKGDVPLRWALCHRVGIPAIDGDVTLDDIVGWHGVVAAVAAQKPEWEPGTRHGYHARSYGWILGEVVRRVTGRTLGTYFADEIAGPLNLEWWIGTPPRVQQRAARLIEAPPPENPEVREMLEAALAPGTLLQRVSSGPSNLFSYDDQWNSAPLLTAEMPSSNGVATARSIARMYAATIGDIDGVRLLEDETIDSMRVVHSEGPDAVLGIPTAFGLGFAVGETMLGPAAPATAFGHPGAGGSLGLADPERGIAFGYAMNQMKQGVDGDDRSASLVRAVFR